MRRFTITVPIVDQAGRPRTDYAEYVENRLRASGFEGWTVLEGNGVWQRYREPVRVYVIDGDESSLEGVTKVAQDFRSYGNQEAVYVTAEPIEAILVTEPSPFEASFEPAFVTEAWTPDASFDAAFTNEEGFDEQ